MSPNRSVSRGAWLGLVASAMLGAAAWGVTQRGQPFAGGPDRVCAALIAERAALRGADDAACAQLRAEAAAVSAHAWNDPALTAFAQPLAPGWTCEWENHPRSRAILRRVAPRLEEWSDYVAALSRWSRLPGVAVEAVDLQVAGEASDRQFTHVQVILRFRRAEATTGDAGRSADAPPPVAAAEVRPRPGKSGRHSAALLSDPTLRVRAGA